MENKKGFTLIELLAVIVILGILMLIAIPSVTKYIDSSKKETYVKTISNMVDVVRYGVVSENSKYSMDRQMKKFSLIGIELEKGSNKSPYGDLVEDYSYVVVTKTSDGYKYEVQVKDTGNYCIELVNIDELDKSKIKKCENSSMQEYSKAYKIGDKIEFSGSNWYVIQDSSKDDEYVTVLKEKLLTNAELGEYAINYVCSENNIKNNDYGCTSEKTVINYNSMAYYYSDTCHNAGIYGYTNYDNSGCSGHNDYEGSKVKEFLEESYINKLGADNLVEVDGYKIRLISVEELRNNLGWTNGNVSYNDGNKVPSFIITSPQGTLRYLTMTSKVSTSNTSIYGICSEMIHESGIIDYYCYGQYQGGVRPVINLLKSSI